MSQGKYTDGRTINVVAPAGGVMAGRLYRINGWNGVAEVDAAAGETFAMNIDPVFTFYIPMPSGVAAALGDVLYMPTASGGTGATALTATATSNVAAVKVHQAKDANNIVGVRLLNNA